MKRILPFIVNSILTLHAVLGFSQDDQVNSLDALIQRQLKDPNFQTQLLFVDTTDNGEIDSIRFIFKVDTLLAVWHKRYVSAYSYGEGPPYADIHISYLYHLNKGKIIKATSSTLTEYFVDYEKGNKTTLSESKQYSDSFGNCVACFGERTVEGTTRDIFTKIKLVDWRRIDCMFCLPPKFTEVIESLIPPLKR